MKKFLSQPRVLLVGLITVVLSGLFSTYYWFFNRPAYDYLTVGSGRTWGRAIRSDAVGYYSWIPTVLNEFPNLCGRQFADSSMIIQPMIASSFHLYSVNSACVIPAYTAGLPLTWLPVWITVHIPQFFGFHEGVHANSHLSNLDGFAIALSGAIFGIVGCIYLFKSLLLIIPSRAIFITFVSFFGTSAYHHSSFDSVLSHSASFMFISILLYLCFRPIASIKKFSITISIIMAMIILVRPTNILISILIFPSLINQIKSNNPKQLSDAFAWWFAIIALAAGIFVAIQGTLWYLVTGQILINSYDGVPSTLDGFAISSLRSLPEVLYGQSGLLMFSPFMAFALIGLTKSLPGMTKLTLASIRVSILSIFIVITLWPASANHMGGWGSRMFIDFLPLFAIGIATLYVWLIRKQRRTWPLSFVLMICVFINLFQMFSYWLGNWENSRFLFNVLH